MRYDKTDLESIPMLEHIFFYLVHNALRINWGLKNEERHFSCRSNK